MICAGFMKQNLYVPNGRIYIIVQGSLTIQSSFWRSAAWVSCKLNFEAFLAGDVALDGARDVILDSAILESIVLTAWNEKSNSPTKPLTCLRHT